jgi:alkylation response protein AidB-like acyl-CoA dehydrogenase
MNEMGEMGFLGVMTSEKYGGSGLGYVAYGLVAREVERVDSGYRSAMSVQNSLVMHPDRGLWQRGAEAEVPAASSPPARWVGCFGLTEPDARLRSRRHEDARRQGAGRLRAERRQDVDHQFADRRRCRGLGQGRGRASSAASSSSAA